MQDALPSITSSVKVTIESIGQVATTTAGLTSTIRQALADNELTDEERQAISATITDFQKNIQQQQAAFDSLIAFLTNIQNSGSNADLEGIITQLSNAKTSLGVLSDRLLQLNNLVQNGSVDEITAYLDQVTAAAQNITDHHEQHQC